MAISVSATSTTHTSLERHTPLVEGISVALLLLPLQLAVFDEGIEGFDFVLQILDDELNHDGIIEVAKAGDAVGDQIIRIREIREGIEDALTIRTLEAPIVVLDHIDQLAELRDSGADEFRRLGLLDLDEQGSGFVEDDTLIFGALSFADFLENLSKITEVFVAEFEGDLHHGAEFNQKFQSRALEKPQESRPGGHNRRNRILCEAPS